MQEKKRKKKEKKKHKHKKVDYALEMQERERLRRVSDTTLNVSNSPLLYYSMQWHKYLQRRALHHKYKSHRGVRPHSGTCSAGDPISTVLPTCPMYSHALTGKRHAAPMRCDAIMKGTRPAVIGHFVKKEESFEIKQTRLRLSRFTLLDFLLEFC